MYKWEAPSFPRAFPEPDHGTVRFASVLRLSVGPPVPSYLIQLDPYLFELDPVEF